MAPKRNPRHEHAASIKTAASRLPSDVIGVIAGFLPASIDALRPLMLVSNGWFRGVVEQDGMQPKPGVRWPWVALAHRKPCTVALVAVMEEAVYELVEAVPDLEELIVDGPVKEPAALQYLTLLPKLTSLQFLRCYGRPVSAIVSRVVKLPQLQKLVLNEPEMKNPELKSITQKLPELRSLTITMKPFDNIVFNDTSLKYIGDNLQKLEELRIPYASKVTDAGIKHVSSGCQELTSVDLQQYRKITSKSLEHLKQCKKLTSLDLSEKDALADTGLEHLGEMVQLKTLIVAGCASDFKVCEECLQCFRNLVNLEIVRLTAKDTPFSNTRGQQFLNALREQLDSQTLLSQDTFFSDKVSFSQTKQLRSLKLRSIGESHNLSTIGECCPELTNLDLVSTNPTIADAHAQHIVKLNKLKSLSLHGCELSEAGGLSFAHGLLELESIFIEGFTTWSSSLKTEEERCASNGFLCHISRLTKLKNVTINSKVNVDDAGFASLKNLQTIHLPQAWRLTDDGVKQLVDNNPNLTSLEFCTATDASLEYIAHNLLYSKSLKFRTTIQMGMGKAGVVTKVGMQAVIQNMQQLEELCLKVDMLEDDALKDLGERLPNLRVLDIASYKITGEVLKCRDSNR